MLELYAGTPPSYWQASYVYIYNKILTLFAAMDMNIQDVEVINERIDVIRAKLSLICRLIIALIKLCVCVLEI